jgi:ACR3 family arsenite efflux pump ArsB
MSEATTLPRPPQTRQAPAMGVFERYLTLWVALCIVAGVVLGQAMPAVFHAVGGATVAALVWLMIIPMLLKIDLAALGHVKEHWRGITVTAGINWLVKPFSLALHFFELAVATAIALFGFQSGAALARVVGVLVEVPVMLSVVHIVRRTRGWYEHKAAA